MRELFFTKFFAKNPINFAKLTSPIITRNSANFRKMVFLSFYYINLSEDLCELQKYSIFVIINAVKPEDKNGVNNFSEDRNKCKIYKK